MTSAATVASRFVRRTSLREDEYRVNFKQIDCDVLDTLTSDEASTVTPSMAKIYIRLIRSPLNYWERDGVLHLTGEEQEDGAFLTAWEQLRELTGVANSTLSKALTWMHKVGVIGYDAHKNGVGIRIFINRALSSIRSTTAQKNLRLVPTPSVSSPAPSPGTPFKENSHRGSLEKDINPRTPSRAAGTSLPDQSPGGTATESSSSRERPEVEAFVKPVSAALDLGQIVGLVKSALAPVITSACDDAVAAACRREAALNREWFEKAGLPKAIRVAQHEAFNVLRSNGAMAKKSSSEANLGRNHSAQEKGREPESEKDRVAAFLAEARACLKRVAAKNTDAERAALRDACLLADGGLGQLHDRLLTHLQPDLQEIEGELQVSEQLLTSALWRITSASDLEALLQAARIALRAYEGRMDRAVFDETVRGQVTAALRERHGIPRINLFYL